MEVKIDSSQLDMVKIGRIVGLAIIALSLVRTLAYIVDLSVHGTLSALSGVGSGVLILVATEILRILLASRGSGDAGDGDAEETAA